MRETLTNESKRITNLLKYIDANHSILFSKSGISNKGFFDLPMTLVDAMTSQPEIRWGGNYSDTKDFMHFELNPLKKYL